MHLALERLQLRFGQARFELRRIQRPRLRFATVGHGVPQPAVSAAPRDKCHFAGEVKLVRTH